MLVLDDRQIEQFNQDGFLLIKQIFAPDEVKALQDAFALAPMGAAPAHGTSVL